MIIFDLFEDNNEKSQGVTEGQYEIHHLDPEGRRKAIYHHGKGYTDDVVRKDTQYHQERNPRDTFQVFKDKQPFDWQDMAEGKKRKKKKASKSLGRYFFPGYGYYGSGESGEGGGDGGGGESVNRSVAEAIREKGALKAAQDAAKFIIRNLDDRNALRNYSAHFWSPEKFYQGATMAMRPGISVDDIVKAIKQDRPAQFEGIAESLEDYERYQYIVTLKSGKRIRFLCSADCDVKTYIERKYNEPVVDIKDQGIVGEPPVELLPGERGKLNELAPTQKQPSEQEGKINAELRKLRAQYPDARSDLEAVAIGGMEAHDDARKHLARVDAIVSKLDRAADQLQSVNTDQDSELNVLDRENNDLEQKIKDLEQKLSKVSQPRTKAADMPTQAKQDKQAKQDNTPQDVAPVAQRKPTAEPAAPAQSKQEPADKGVGLGHMAAQLKDLPSTINIGKKSVPDQLPPNVSKVNFDPDFGPAIARRGNLDEESGVSPYQENDINLGAYNLTQTGSAWESRVPSITLQFGPNKSLRMSRPQLFAIMAILSSTDVEQDQQQQAATERVRAFKKILSSRDRTIAWLQHPEVQTFVASYPAWQAHQAAKNKNQQQKDLLTPQEPVQQELFRESTPVTEVSPEYIERYKKEHGKRATAADQAGDYAKGHEHFKKINKLTKQQFQRGSKPEKVDEISNFMTQPTKPVTPEEQWKRWIRLLAKQYQTNASSLAALARENGPDSAEAVAYEYLRDPSKIRVPGTAAPASAVNWDEVIRRLPMGLSGMALLQAAEEYLINNRGMLRSTVRSLLNNDENQRTLSAAYAKKKTPAESVTEESDNEAVEQAIIRRIMVGRTDLLLKYGPKKVMQAVEEVADRVGLVNKISDNNMATWVSQVERELGGMSEAANPSQQAAIAINMKKNHNEPKKK